MKTIRLLPVVIAAAAALLMLKGVGLLTGGGYLFNGVSTVAAAGAPPVGGHGEAEVQAPVDGVPSIELPGSPTIGDHAPTLEDDAPTMGSGHGSGDGHGTEVADHSIPAPVTADGEGTKLALEALENPPADAALLARLAERRQALDAREADLGMRLSLVEAAEKRIAERMAELQALEAQVAALVDQKEGAEAAQFKALVTMYEAMKPRDAAAILNSLDVAVLLPIARGISPRRMAPILAAMDPGRAQELTARLAVGGEAGRSEPEPPLARDPPQIIGQ